ncbi:hypothetical protein ASU31_00370 [Pedobacter ginsenosidimutans]|uniref:Rad50/SbcC-type AAA domain-containing protein n=2 Tax=Pedobacter ginsenosidimutans TaxID=687842 RepID=A0A0T5VV99_9SPHI|nr:hypothetical protein ASU31_00370 [Pedobacter ginsenosidimutans]
MILKTIWNITLEQNNMFIEQIIINNFRVYQGINTVNFAMDADQNITVIAGNNGFGKTSFLTSLVWGLYGKLMNDVDERYRQDINEAGGYTRYCEKLMNRIAHSEAITKVGELKAGSEKNTLTENQLIHKLISDLSSFSITLKLSNIMIPSVPCKQVEVTRSYNVTTHKEKLTILIDGRENELTKNVGPEIFINDFILPKEIAKFFFFDAEKIVSLADVNTVEEKKYLSQAYAEVLGIKKYTDLKASLTQMRYRIREKSASKSDRSALDKLNRQLEQARKMIEHKRNQLEGIVESIQIKRTTSDVHQEQLIREGSSITIEEIKRLREQKHILADDLSKLKSRFNDMLELAPFAMLVSKMTLVKKQLELESSNSAAATALLKTKFAAISKLVTDSNLALDNDKKDFLLSLIEQELIPKDAVQVKALLSFTPDQQQKFYVAYENITTTFGKSFKVLINDQKRLQGVFNNVNRKLQDGEAKGKDPVIASIRKTKEKLDDEIKLLLNEQASLHADVYKLENEINSLSRQTSELSKKVILEDVDKEKDETAERLIQKLDVFIQKLKNKKKGSLEKNIQYELNRLMHKSDFVSRVHVLIEGDLIDIELYDNQSRFIDKELLSKGEQQLYATALLKALVDESNVRFPVFIDSPLQKFDKNHSHNIIKEFYPNLSAQVVLFPLLQKELNEEEYSWMVDRVGKAYLIKQNDKYNSGFEQTEPNLLFTWYQQTQKAYV